MDPYEFISNESSSTKLTLLKPKGKRKRRSRLTFVVSTISKNSRSQQLTNVGLHLLLDRQAAFIKVKLPFLLPSQIRGRALGSLGLPNVMGKMPRWNTFRYGRNIHIKPPNHLTLFNFTLLVRNFISEVRVRRNTFSIGGTSHEDNSSAQIDSFDSETSDDEVQSENFSTIFAPSPSCRRVQVVEWSDDLKQIVQEDRPFNEEVDSTDAESMIFMSRIGPERTSCLIKKQGDSPLSAKDSATTTVPETYDVQKSQTRFLTPRLTLTIFDESESDEIDVENTPALETKRVKFNNNNYSSEGGKKYCSTPHPSHNNDNTSSVISIKRKVPTTRTKPNEPIQNEPEFKKKANPKQEESEECSDFHDFLLSPSPNDLDELLEDIQESGSDNSDIDVETIPKFSPRNVDIGKVNTSTGESRKYLESLHSKSNAISPTIDVSRNIKEFMQTMNESDSEEIDVESIPKKCVNFDRDSSKVTGGKKYLKSPYPANASPAPEDQEEINELEKVASNNDSEEIDVENTPKFKPKKLKFEKQYPMLKRSKKYVKSPYPAAVSPATEDPEEINELEKVSSDNDSEEIDVENTPKFTPKKLKFEKQYTRLKSGKKYVKSPYPAAVSPAIKEPAEITEQKSVTSDSESEEIDVEDKSTFTPINFKIEKQNTRITGGKKYIKFLYPVAVSPTPDILGEINELEIVASDSDSEEIDVENTPKFTSNVNFKNPNKRITRDKKYIKCPYPAAVSPATEVPGEINELEIVASDSDIEEIDVESTPELKPKKLKFEKDNTNITGGKKYIKSSYPAVVSPATEEPEKINELKSVTSDSDSEEIDVENTPELKPKIFKFKKQNLRITGDKKHTKSPYPAAVSPATEKPAEITEHKSVTSDGDSEEIDVEDMSTFTPKNFKIEKQKTRIIGGKKYMKSPYPAAVSPTPEIPGEINEMEKVASDSDSEEIDVENTPELKPKIFKFKKQNMRITGDKKHTKSSYPAAVSPATEDPGEINELEKVLSDNDSEEIDVKNTPKFTPKKLKFEKQYTRLRSGKKYVKSPYPAAAFPAPDDLKEIKKPKETKNKIKCCIIDADHTPECTTRISKFSTENTGITMGKKYLKSLHPKFSELSPALGVFSEVNELEQKSNVSNSEEFDEENIQGVEVKKVNVQSKKLKTIEENKILIFPPPTLLHKTSHTTKTQEKKPKPLNKKEENVKKVNCKRAPSVASWDAASVDSETNECNSICTSITGVSESNSILCRTPLFRSRQSCTFALPNTELNTRMSHFLKNMSQFTSPTLLSQEDLQDSPDTLISLIDSASASQVHSTGEHSDSFGNFLVNMFDPVSPSIVGSQRLSGDDNFKTGEFPYSAEL